MRLIYLHQYFAFPDIHSSTRSYDLATEFIRDGIKVTVITTTTKIKGLDERRRWNYIERDQICLWVLTCNYNQTMNPLSRIKAFLRFMIFATFKTLRLEADLVLATSSPLSVAIPALLKKKLSGVPYVFEVRDIWLETLIKTGYLKNRLIINILSYIEKVIYKNANHIVPLSIDMEKSILDTVPTAKTTVIPNISEINRFQASIVNFDIGIKVKPAPYKYILYAGAIARGNGLMYVAEMAKVFIKINPFVIFIVIGAGNERDTIIEYCKNSGILNKNIFFPQPVPKEKLPFLYQIATMGSSFVINHPVLWANSANKFFDTLAAGKPVLINYLGWQADLIKRENLGYVLPPIITHSDIVKFNEYLNNTDLLAIQSRNSLDVAKSKFSLKIAAQKYSAILKC